MTGEAPRTPLRPACRFNDRPAARCLVRPGQRITRPGPKSPTSPARCALVPVEQVVLPDVRQLAGLVPGDHQVTVEGPGMTRNVQPCGSVCLRPRVAGLCSAAGPFVGVGGAGLHDEDFADARDVCESGSDTDHAAWASRRDEPARVSAVLIDLPAGPRLWGRWRHGPVGWPGSCLAVAAGLPPGRMASTRIAEGCISHRVRPCSCIAADEGIAAGTGVRTFGPDWMAGRLC